MPLNVKPIVSFKASKLASRFNIKDKTNIQHRHNVVYKLECPQEQCTHTYIGETARRLHVRISEHGGKDKRSSLLRHSVESGHDKIKLENAVILASNLGNYKQRKIAEALFIKEHKPSLNEQGQSIPLSLMN